MDRPTKSPSKGKHNQSHQLQNGKNSVISQSLPNFQANVISTENNNSGNNNSSGSPTSSPLSHSSLSPAKWKSFFFKQSPQKSPINVQISHPFDVNHTLHVDFDPESQQLQGLPSNWTSTLKRSANKLIKRRRDSTSQRNLFKANVDNIINAGYAGDGASGVQQSFGPTSRLPIPVMDLPSRKMKSSPLNPNKSIPLPVPIAKQYARNSTPSLAQSSMLEVSSMTSSGSNTSISSMSSDFSVSSHQSAPQSKSPLLNSSVSQSKSTSFNGIASTSMVIGNPMQTKRELHITWNHVTGQFEGVPDDWSDLVQRVTTEKQEKHRHDQRKRLLKEELSKCEREERHRRSARDRRERSRVNREERSMSVTNRPSVTTPPVSPPVSPRSRHSTLYQISGVEMFKSKRVELSLQSLCKNDVFVLDSTSKLYVWMGSLSSLQKQVRGLAIAAKIKYESQVILEPISIEILVDRDRRDSALLGNFYKLLNGEISDGQVFDVARESVDSDAELAEFEESTTWLYRVSDNGKIVSIDDRPLIPTLLNCNTCFIMDCETDIFVWCGRNSHPLQQRVATVFANEFIQIFSERPGWASLHNVHQDEEPWYFKERFLYWLEEESVIDNSRRYTIRAKDTPLPIPPVPLDSPTLIPELLVDPHTPEPKRGVTLSIDLWQSENSTWTKVEQEHYGHFLISRAYVCHHVYKLDDRINSRVYFWQGSEAPIKWWIVYQFGLYKELQAHMRQLAPTLPPPNTECLTQHKETPPFMNLFGNYIMVHRDTTNTILLYHLTLSSCEQFVRCTQFANFNLSNLNTRQVFILYNQSLKSSFIWYGNACSDYLRAEAVDVANSLHTYLQQNNDPTVFNLVVECQEHNEPISFWKQFAGVDKRLEQFTLNSTIDLTGFLKQNTIRPAPKTNVYQIAANLPNDKTYHTRLYHIYYHSKARKYVVTRVKPFCQSDLVAEDAFVLDTLHKLHIWIGPQCSRKKRETAEMFAKMYRNQSTLGHSPVTPIEIESYRSESYEFRSFFDAWHSEFQPQSLRNITAQALIGIGADYRLLNSIACTQIQNYEFDLGGEESDDETAFSMTPSTLTPHSSPPVPKLMEKWEMELENEVERLKKKGYSPMTPIRLSGLQRLSGMPSMKLTDPAIKRSRDDSIGSVGSVGSVGSSSGFSSGSPERSELAVKLSAESKRNRSDSNEMIAQASKARLKKRGSSLLSRSPLGQNRLSTTLPTLLNQAVPEQDLKEWTVEMELDLEVSKLEEELSKLNKMSEENKASRSALALKKAAKSQASAAEPEPSTMGSRPPFSPRKPSPLVAALPPPPPPPTPSPTEFATPVDCSAQSTPRTTSPDQHLRQVQASLGFISIDSISNVSTPVSSTYSTPNNTSPISAPVKSSVSIPPLSSSNEHIPQSPPKEIKEVSVLSPKVKPAVPPRALITFLASSETLSGAGSLSKGTTPKPLPYVPPKSMSPPATSAIPTPQPTESSPSPSLPAQQPVKAPSKAPAKAPSKASAKKQSPQPTRVMKKPAAKASPSTAQQSTSSATSPATSPMSSPTTSPATSPPVSPRENTSNQRISASMLPSPPTDIPVLPLQQEVPKTRFKFIVKPLTKTKPVISPRSNVTTSVNSQSIGKNSIPFSNYPTTTITNIKFDPNDYSYSYTVPAKKTMPAVLPPKRAPLPIFLQNHQQQNTNISPDKHSLTEALSPSVSPSSSPPSSSATPKPLPYPPSSGSVRDKINQHESFTKLAQPAVHSLPIMKPSPPSTQKYTSLQAIFIPPTQSLPAKPLPPPPPPRNFSPTALK